MPQTPKSLIKLRPEFERLARRDSLSQREILLIETRKLPTATHKLTRLIKNLPDRVKPDKASRPFGGDYGRSKDQVRRIFYWRKPMTAADYQPLWTLCEEAGKCVTDWATNLGIDSRTTELKSATMCWACVLFELAWLSPDLYRVTANRRPLVSSWDDQLTLILSSDNSENAIAAQNVTEQNKYGFYAVLRNPLRASVQAIDAFEGMCGSLATQIIGELPTHIETGPQGNSPQKPHIKQKQTRRKDQAKPGPKGPTRDDIETWQAIKLDWLRYKSLHKFKKRRPFKNTDWERWCKEHGESSDELTLEQKKNALTRLNNHVKRHPKDDVSLGSSENSR